MSRQLISAALLLALGTLSSVIVSDAAPAAVLDEQIAQSDALLNQSPVANFGVNEEPEVKRTETVTITAYSSEVAQTDDTPFITASGTTVRDGIVAANWLPIGTKIRIPELFGDKVFVVEDRMNRRHTHRVDIWFSSKSEAVAFGLKKAEVEIL